MIWMQVVEGIEEKQPSIVREEVVMFVKTHTHFNMMLSQTMRVIVWLFRISPRQNVH